MVALWQTRRSLLVIETNSMRYGKKRETREKEEKRERETRETIGV